MLLLQAVRRPGEFVKPIVEVIRDIRSRLAPWFRRFGWKVTIEVGRKDGLASGRINGVPSEINGRSMSRRVIATRFLIGRRGRFPV